MRVALAQISPHLGDIEKNRELHLQQIARAKKNKADLIVFPELSLTGYSLRDLVAEVAIDPEKSRLMREFKSLSREMAIVLGFVEEKPQERGIFYNSAAFLSRGRILHIHRKVFLPTFGMFEEGRFFTPGKNFGTFPTPFGNAGLMICRDFLHYGASYLLFAGGSEMNIVISAAPGRGVSTKESYGSSRMWELMGEAISLFSSVFVIYCGRVGIEDGMVFGGGSYVFGPQGKLLARASYLDRDFLIRDISLDSIRGARRKMDFKKDEKPEVMLEALRRIVAGYGD
jgi:predicted amidohydrolase